MKNERSLRFVGVDDSGKIVYKQNGVFLVDTNTRLGFLKIEEPTKRLAIPEHAPWPRIINTLVNYEDKQVKFNE